MNAFQQGGCLAGGEGSRMVSGTSERVAPPEGWAHFKLSVHFLGR